MARAFGIGRRNPMRPNHSFGKSWEIRLFLPHAAGFCLFLLGKPHVMRSYFLKSEKNWDSMGLQLGGEVYLHVVVVSSCSPRFIRILRVLPTR